MKQEHGEIIIYQAEDGQTALEVQLAEETVWLPQKQIASLFETERSVITKHIGNIFRTGELDQIQYVQNLHILPQMAKPTWPTITTWM